MIDINLSSGPSAASEARKHLKAIAGDLPADRFEDIRLLVSELVTNSVRHSVRQPEDPQTVGLSVKKDSKCLRVDVFDKGAGFAKEVTPVTPEQQSGWGLQIVETLTDRWGVDPLDGVGIDRLVRDRSLAQGLSSYL